MGNAVVSTVLQFASAFVLLAVTPYMLGPLGLDTYGLWALLNRIGRYGMLTAFGLGPSITRHVAQQAARDDFVSVRAATTVGVLC
jgi:O-antigen/teichoic acid export membrane protein